MRPRNAVSSETATSSFRHAPISWVAGQTNYHRNPSNSVVYEESHYSSSTVINRRNRTSLSRASLRTTVAGRGRNARVGSRIAIDKYSKTMRMTNWHRIHSAKSEVEGGSQAQHRGNLPRVSKPSLAPGSLVLGVTRTLNTSHLHR